MSIHVQDCRKSLFCILLFKEYFEANARTACQFKQISLRDGYIKFPLLDFPTFFMVVRVEASEILGQLDLMSGTNYCGYPAVSECSRAAPVLMLGNLNWRDLHGRYAL